MAEYIGRTQFANRQRAALQMKTNAAAKMNKPKTPAELQQAQIDFTAAEGILKDLERYIVVGDDDEKLQSS
jgi:hypothetical protein